MAKSQLPTRDMRNLTNFYADLEVWDLDPDRNRRGPFLVVQFGVAPADEQVRERMFVLRRNGQWVDFLYYVTQDKPGVMDETLFASTHDVMELLEQLDLKPQVVDVSVDDSALKRWLERTKGEGPMEPFRLWLDEYHQRHSETD